MTAPLAQSGPDGPPGAGSDGGWRSLVGLTVPAFAWEFLRRNPDYRADYARALPQMESRWGLRFPVDPMLPARAADVFWREEVAPGIVLPILEADTRHAERGPFPHLDGNRRTAEEGLHVRLAAGLQLLFKNAAASSGPVLVVLGLDQDFSVRVRAVEALDRVVRGRAPPKSRLTSAQRVRLARCLVALDGAERRESYREIAKAVFGEDTIDRGTWRTASVRDATIRLVRSGRDLMRGGYLKLLKGGL